MNLRPRAPFLICACAALALSACGSSSSTTSSSTTGSTSTPAPATTSPAKSGSAAKAVNPSAASTVSLQADPSGQLAYVQKSLTAKAGKVRIVFNNASPVPHDVAVAQGANQLGVTPVGNGTVKLAVTLAKGTYTFYCTVPGHRAAGMQGTLTVS